MNPKASQAIPLHFFVLTQAFVHQHPRRPLYRREHRLFIKSPTPQTHGAELELNDEAGGEAGISQLCPAWWDFREAISLGSVPFFRQTGAFPVAGHSAPKRWTQMDLGIKEGSVRGSRAVLPCFEHTNQVGGRPPLVQGRPEGTFNKVSPP